MALRVTGKAQNKRYSVMEKPYKQPAEFGVYKQPAEFGVFKGSKEN